MKMYQDLKKCPLCGGNTKKKGSVYLEFKCQERGCEAIVRFPSELKIDADEQIRRFNNRITEPEQLKQIFKKRIDELRHSPWFNDGHDNNDIVMFAAYQGRREALSIIEDLIIDNMFERR